MPRKKLLFVFLQTYSMTGGLQRFNRRVIANADALAAELDVEFECLVLGDRPEDLPSLPNVAIRAVPGRLSFLVRSVLWALRRCDGLILGHVNLLPVAWLARTLRPDLVAGLFVHGDEVWGDPAMRPLKPYDRFMARSLGRIACVSHFTGDVMSRVFGIDRERFLLLPNAVDGLAQPQPNSLPPGRHVLTVSRVGRFDRRKHIDCVIRAVSLLKDEMDDLVFDFVGEGELLGELVALADALGIGDRARFHGRVSDEELQALYRQARVFVLPSSKEGFGIVFLEAWQHGVPVICGSRGASHEIVQDGVDGFVVDETDIRALAGRLRFLLTDDDARQAFGEAGRRKVQSAYQNENFRANLCNFLAALYAHRPGAAFQSAAVIRSISESNAGRESSRKRP